MNEIQPLQPDELERILPILLAAPGTGQLATPVQIDSFRDYLRAGPLGWLGWRCGPVHEPKGTLVAVLLPGATAIMMIPTPGEHGIDPHAQRSVLRTGLNRLSTRHLHYAQAVTEPNCTAKNAALLDAGFKPLAPLLYLERDTRYPWVDPPDDPGLEWLTFDTTTRPVFTSTILATYRDSQDCPELTGLRPIDDVLAAHQATGPFDPQLWTIARIKGMPAGCLLLARLGGGELFEVVYMGVVPEFRRGGVATRLLKRALISARAARARSLTVVVDARNGPALKLYESFAFSRMAEREAYLYRWDAPEGEQQS